MAYLRQLGITSMYLSPILQASPGSRHGYDMTDPQRINSELGGETAFESFMLKSQTLGFDVILDFVPNHQSTHFSNPYWWDVMKNGPESTYSDQFDIWWENLQSHERRKLVLPVLASHLADVLQKEELKLDLNTSEPFLQYYEHRFPLAPSSVPFAKGGDSIEHLLSLQNYELAFWRDGLARLNYRRFFNIAELAGIRIELPEVYERIHKKLFEILETYPAIKAIRIDHIDGLKRPTEYLKKLREDLQSRGLKIEVLVEKILAMHEHLPKSWPIEGTTGYETMNRINEVFISAPGYGQLQSYYEQRQSYKNHDKMLSPAQKLYGVKLEIIDKLFQPEFERLECKLKQLDGMDTPKLINALKELTAAMPVYRAYPENLSESDPLKPVWQAFELLNHFGAKFTDEYHAWWHDLFQGKTPLDQQWVLDFLQGWQQVCGAVMAKGYEDCFLYRYYPLLSRNEVGSQITSAPMENAWQDLATCFRSGTYSLGSMNATATHDMKRGEDARARLNVLSEIPGEWHRILEDELAWASAQPQRLDANVHFLIYQSLFAHLPLEAESSFLQRWQDYLVKSLREGQQFTSWLDVNVDFEARVKEFAATVLSERIAFQEFTKQNAVFGALNSLSQLLLKTFLPGKPDYYQGTELWDYSFVDPDNRRAVDYQKRVQILESSSRVRSLEASSKESLDLRSWQSGNIKLWLLQKALQLRTELPWLDEAEMQILEAEGERKSHVMAFQRSSAEKGLIVVLSRFYYGLLDGQPEYRSPNWHDTRVALPDGRWQVASGETVYEGSFECTKGMHPWPFALLLKI